MRGTSGGLCDGMFQGYTTQDLDGIDDGIGFGLYVILNEAGYTQG